MPITISQSQAIKSKNRATLRRLGGIPRRMATQARNVMKRWGDRQLRDMAGRFGGRPGLISRRGILRGSFAYTVQSRGTALHELSIYSDGTGRGTKTGQGYARTHEGYPTHDKPTIITRRRVSAMTVPLDANRLPGGGLKYESAADLRAQGRTKIIVSKWGTVMIAVMEGDEWNPMWVLKYQVRIPARLQFRTSFNAREGERRKQLDAAIRSAIAP